MITHKNNNLKIILFVLFGYVVTTITAQNTLQTSQLKKVNLDTISYIKIEKSIFYKDPLVMEYSSLTDTTYIPEWYNAFCACFNVDHFKEFSKEAIKFYHSDCGTSETRLNDYYNRVQAAGGVKEFQKETPYLYIYGEIRLTYTKTGDRIVLVHGSYCNNKINYPRFNQPIKEKNIDIEKVDSASQHSCTIFAYIYENGILKEANQMHVIGDLISNGGNYFIGDDLKSFKDMMFRTPIFIQSEVVNGKRVFETMQKAEKSHLKIKESNKP